MIRTQHDGLVYYQFERLCAEPGLRHGFFTRLGGVSRPPFSSLNLGATVGDDVTAVAENRRRMYAALGFGAGQVVTPFQVHSTIVTRVGHAEGGQVIEATDGLLSAAAGMALVLRFADCALIMLYDPEHRAIGLVHAGWRGTLHGIAAEAVRAMAAQWQTRPEQLWAGIGPAIGPCCYEVGADLAAEFARRFGTQVVHRAGSGRSHLDLPAANDIALREAGVATVELSGLCTACHVDEFFSHRKEGGRTGRLGALIGLAG